MEEQSPWGTHPIDTEEFPVTKAIGWRNKSPWGTHPVDTEEFPVTKTIGWRNKSHWGTHPIDTEEFPMTKAIGWRNKAIEETKPLTPREGVDDTKELPVSNRMEEESHWGMCAIHTKEFPKTISMGWRNKAIGEHVPLTPWHSVDDIKELPMTSRMQEKRHWATHPIDPIAVPMTPRSFQ